MDITEICAYVRNYFAPTAKKTDLSYIHSGVYTISDHAISPLDFIAEGQYFRIAGSAMNDGVYLNTAEGLATLADETFTGQIWEMSVPPAFLKLCADITAWREKYESADSGNMSPYSSESFAGYSYSKGNGGTASSGSGATWQDQFSARLNAWKRVFVL